MVLMGTFIICNQLISGAHQWTIQPRDAGFVSMTRWWRNSRWVMLHWRRSVLEEAINQRFMNQDVSNRPFSHCIDQAGLGAFTAKSGRKHYNPPPLTVMWMNFDSPNFPSFCSLSAIISFQTCSNKCILYVLSFHKCIKIKYKMVNMYWVFRD